MATDLNQAIPVNPLLLIDGDILAYRVAAAAQKSYDFDGDGAAAIFTITEEELDEALDEALSNWTSPFPVDAPRYVCLSCPTEKNWRLKVYPQYKSNRKDVVRPELLSMAKAILATKGHCLTAPNLEADDLMGIYATDPEFFPEHTKVIISIDKDMKTVPGWHYNPVTEETFQITLGEADRYHMLQTLTGDTTDGYPGCPGVGPVKASHTLGDAEELSILWDRTMRLYYQQAFSQALRMAQVSNILRHGQYNFKTRRVNLWTPPVQ